jgi:hypothetical protein
MTNVIAAAIQKTISPTASLIGFTSVPAVGFI